MQSPALAVAPIEGAGFPVYYFPVNPEKVPEFRLHRFDCVEEKECGTVYRHPERPWFDLKPAGILA